MIFEDLKQDGINLQKILNQYEKILMTLISQTKKLLIDFEELKGWN
jgi:hypothetical protein